MMLEEVARQYGMHDYLDNCAGKIFQLSNAIKDADDTLLVPVVDVFGDGIIREYARMNNVLGI